MTEPAPGVSPVDPGTTDPNVTDPDVADPGDTGRSTPGDTSSGADPVVVEPASVRPGDRVALTFPDGRERGVAWLLQRRAGAAWVDAFWLVSDAAGAPTRSAPAGDESFGWELVRLDGPGPDHVRVPDLATPGAYRLCTIDDEPACTDLVVRRPGDQPGGPRPTGPVVPPPRD